MLAEKAYVSQLNVVFLISYACTIQHQPTVPQFQLIRLLLFNIGSKIFSYLNTVVNGVHYQPAAFEELTLILET